MLRLITIFAIFMLLTPHLNAENLEDGNTAFEARQYEKALSIWLELANKGNIEAQLKVSKMHINGFGTKQDIEQSIFWLEKAVSLGSHQAEFELGKIFGSGRYIKIDLEKSVQWYRRAAIAGHANAQYSLGVSYFKGRGLPVEYETAYAWMSLASEQDLSVATSFRDMIGSVLKPSELEKALLLTEQLKKQFSL